MRAFPTWSSRIPLPVALLVAAAVAPLQAQSVFPPTSPRFVAVIRLAQDGYPDSARTTIRRLIAATPETDPTYPEALYTSASIARDPDESRRAFLRIALDFSDSPWADKAYYRLALIDYGLNNIDASLSSFRRIFLDYPTSPVIPGAALFGSRAAFQKDDLPLGCDWIRRGLAAVGSDVETKNSLEFARGRCSVGAGVEIGPPLLTESLRVAPTGRGQTPPPMGTPPVRPDSAKPAAAKPAATPAPKPAANNDKFRVQVAFGSNRDAITRTTNALKKAGFTVWAIKSGNATKLQAGPFATREAAQAKLAQLKKIAGGKPFIVPTP